MTTHSGKSIKRWGFLIPIVIAVFITLQIALNTPFNFHPDEIMHADAICYFESRWWPPSLNSDEILYSPYGWSRLYTGEVVYLLYGKIRVLIKPIVSRVLTATSPTLLLQQISFQIFLPVIFREPPCVMAYQVYRIVNVGLFLFTLLIVFFRGRTEPQWVAFGLLLLCVPQVLYIYAYVNSDAWGFQSVYSCLFLC